MSVATMGAATSPSSSSRRIGMSSSISMPAKSAME